MITIATIAFCVRAGFFHGFGNEGAIRIFDVGKRLAAISAKGDPLEMIDRVVPFESFRAEIEAAVLTRRRKEMPGVSRSTSS